MLCGCGLYGLAKEFQNCSSARQIGFLWNLCRIPTIRYLSNVSSQDRHGAQSRRRVGHEYFHLLQTIPPTTAEESPRTAFPYPDGLKGKEAMNFRLFACALALVGCWASKADSADWSISSTSDDDPQAVEPLVTDWTETADYAYPSRWTAWAGAIFLDRSNPRSQSLVRDGETTLLNANNMSFGPQAGIDLNALRHGEVFDVGFRYFQVNNMSAHQRLFPPSSASLDLANPFPIDVPQLDAYYNTSIQSVELNLRKNLTPRLALLAGFRYLALDDDLAHKFDITGDSFSLFKLNVDGINRLYGAQIGADAVLFSAGRFQFESAIKAGIYGNSARNALRVSVLELPTTSLIHRAANTAFVGDWNFSGVVQLNDHWALRGGYQLLWLSGVALSSEQFPVTFPNPIPGLNVITTGDLFLHGALVSVQANW